MIRRSSCLVSISVKLLKLKIELPLRQWWGLAVCEATNGAVSPPDSSRLPPFLNLLISCATKERSNVRRCECSDSAMLRYAMSASAANDPNNKASNAPIIMNECCKMKTISGVYHNAAIAHIRTNSWVLCIPKSRVSHSMYVPVLCHRLPRRSRALLSQSQIHHLSNPGAERPPHRS